MSWCWNPNCVQMKFGIDGGPGCATEMSGHSAPNATAKAATNAKKRRLVLMARIVADRLAGPCVMVTPFPRQHARFVNSSLGDLVIDAMKRLYPLRLMSRIRGILPALWLALPLVLRQQAAALHDLGHAFHRISTHSH